MVPLRAGMPSPRSLPGIAVRKKQRMPHRGPSPAVDVEKRYEIMTMVGEGTFGQVSRSIVVSTAGVVAVKRIKEWSDGLSPSALREISLLKELSHDNIVSLEDSLMDASHTLYLVFPYAEYDLGGILNHFGKRRISTPEPFVKSLMWGLLNGVAYLHSAWVLHRDLKPANLLVGGLGSSQEGVLKIADFGLARIVQDPVYPLWDGASVVTIWYRAPELLMGSQHYTRAVDIWAVGCIFGELLLAHALFRGTERAGNERWQGDQMLKITQILGKPASDLWPELVYMPFWHKLEEFQASEECLKKTLQGRRQVPSDNCLDLLARMLSYNPAHRITAAEVLNHPYFLETPHPTRNALLHLPNYPSVDLPRRPTG